MAIINSVKDFKMKVNEDFLKKAISLEPDLFETIIKPVAIVNCKNENGIWGVEACKDISELNQIQLAKGDKLCLDFGDHHVGYFSFCLESAGSPPDAPAHIRIKFGEKPLEIGEDTATYEGSISSSWLQEEYLHIDVLPSEIKMPRRYAFRYVEIMVKDTSPKYRVVIKDPTVTAVSSADCKQVIVKEIMDPELKKLDQVGVKTLQDCMQKVFEDGPKRDRRLWIGDLRLQAQANYYTFAKNDLVKRCLYLFAGLTQNEGQIGACLFMEPTPQVDDTFLFDYSLYFVSCLYDYYRHAKDMKTLKELADTAFLQIETALQEVDKDGIVKDKDTWWCFVDWADGLNKQGPAQAILIYTMKQGIQIAKWLGADKKASFYQNIVDKIVKASFSILWNEEKGFFVSGAEKQVSWATQIWFVLADIMPKEEKQKLLLHLVETDPGIKMVTPYMYHHFIEALFQAGLEKQAVQSMKYYWGGMIQDGADCFYELWNPDNPNESPYGSNMINSFCHAWSCTPTYFIRKYILKS